jgi:hypothetical protein
MAADDPRFDTELTLTGPWRHPAQMLQEQAGGKGATVHEGETAAALGLAGAPIEAPTHFSQFDPLAFALWGRAWFEHGCISSHFRTMVVEGEEVQATLATTGAGTATIAAEKRDGTPVLAGSVSVGPEHARSALDERLAGVGAPGALHILDQVEVGARQAGTEPVAVDFDSGNGPGYPFSLAEKLERITETHPWYTRDGGASSPWGRPILPMEMISVLANKAGPWFPIRQPSLGLFLDLEIRVLQGPVFAEQPYTLTREVLALSQSRRTESMWVRTDLTDADTGALTASVLLHSGVFKASFPDYPADLL